MSPEVHDDLILRHLDGLTTTEEQRQITRLLAENAYFRLRFSTFVNQAAHLREILDNRLEMTMATQPATAPAPTSLFADLNIDFKRVYYNSVIGGFGGLAGWLLFATAEFLHLLPQNQYVGAIFKGAFVGVCIGFAIAAAEGILTGQSLKRIWNSARFGAGLGAAGGAIGLLFAEIALSVIGGGIWTRALGWGVFGMFVGVSEGVALRMPLKIRYGLLGGLIGGLIGGSTYDGLSTMLNSFGVGLAALAWGSAIGLVILGACIGMMVNLVETLLRKAWLFFLTGRMEGQTRTLESSRPFTLGRDDSCNIVIPNDPKVAAVHAEIVFVNGEFQVKAREGTVVVRRDGFDQQITSHVLQPGDRIMLGDTRMIFRNVEGRKKSS
ncbi:MAG: hypothetical protein KatS3mg105_2247 [Gemmatales bacterium]|nr:MAG: hypothetical protein KatS3mg105_2247 [Gemmatales bacterium]